MSQGASRLGELVGRWARPLLAGDIGPGPFPIVRAWSVGRTIWIAVETDDGERELKASTCFITKTRDV